MRGVAVGAAGGRALAWAQDLDAWKWGGCEVKHVARFDHDSVLRQ